MKRTSIAHNDATIPMELSQAIAAVSSCQWSAALDAWGKVSQTGQFQFLSSFFNAELALRCGKLELASEHLTHCLQFGPSIEYLASLEARISEIKSRRAKSPPADGKIVFTDAEYRTVGRSAIECHDWRGAIDIWNGIVDRSGPSFEAYRRLAKSYESLGDHRNAILYAEEGLRISADPKLAESLAREKRIEVRRFDPFSTHLGRLLKTPALLAWCEAAKAQPSSGVNAQILRNEVEAFDALFGTRLSAGVTPVGASTTLDASIIEVDLRQINALSAEQEPTLMSLLGQAPQAVPEFALAGAVVAADTIVLTPIDLAAVAEPAAPVAGNSNAIPSGEPPLIPEVAPGDDTLILAITYDDPSIRLNQNCARQAGRFVSCQETSTPGIRIALKPGTETPYTLSIDGLCGSPVPVSLVLGANGAMGERHQIDLKPAPETYEFKVRSAKIDTIYLLFRRPAIGDFFSFSKIVLNRRPALPQYQIYTPDPNEEMPVYAPSLIAGRGRIVAGVASMASRAEGLEQAVVSLAQQVHEVSVYLNGYTHVPRFLAGRPEIKTYLSGEFDDRGDAGKFFGLTRTEWEHYISFDDDIVYPPDYVERLVSASRRTFAVTGVHGSIMKFPEASYYDKNGRYVLHFRDKNLHDRRVHVLGTGTTCIPRHALQVGLELPYRNMADIWLALHCAEHRVPQICVQRKFGWLQPFGTDDGSIFQANEKQQSTQAMIVEQSVRKLRSNVCRIKTTMPKIVVGIKTYNRFDYLKGCIESLVATLTPNFDVVLVVADDGSTDGTVQYLKEVRIPIELHVVHNYRKYAVGQFNSILDKAKEVGADFIICIDDDVVFKRPGWIDLYYNEAINSGYHHLCHFNLPHAAELKERKGETLDVTPREHGTFALDAYTGVEGCMGALFTLTPALIDRVGYGDEVNFPIRGLWHIDYSARCCRAGFNEYERFFDVRGSNNFIALQNNVSHAYRSSIDWESQEFKRASSPQERQRRWSVVRQPQRISVQRSDSRMGVLLERDALRAPPPISINTLFDQVFVINLDRRNDRIEAMDRRLRRAGVAYQRFPAVDGRDPQIEAEYLAYVKSRKDAPKPALPPLTSSRDFLMKFQSDMQRVEFLENKIGGPAIRSAGAWAYSRTYEKILNDSLRQGFERILVLDDDCLFHDDFVNLTDVAARQLPPNWRIFQPGVMQYDWKMTRPYSQNLYLPDGMSVASHAVGLHKEVFPVLLEYVQRWTLPFDIGPLFYACRHFRDSSFVAKPNLVIQDQTESDIQSSDVAERESQKADNIYGWDTPKYS